MIKRKQMGRCKISLATSIISMLTLWKIHSSETQDHIWSVAGVELLLCVQLLNLHTSVIDPSQFRHCWKGL
jgi:hypothetical protein